MNETSDIGMNNPIRHRPSVTIPLASAEYLLALLSMLDGAKGDESRAHVRILAIETRAAWAVEGSLPENADSLSL